MNLKKPILFLLIILSLQAQAQIGGRFAFESLSLPSNARVTALGGSLITVQDDDIALGVMNPALLNSSMNKQLSINHHFHLAGISNSNVAFAKSLDSLGVTLMASVQAVNYGTFDLSDEIGNVTGEFSAGEIAVVVGAGKRLNERISAGVNLKFLNSNYESYGSVAMGADVGLHYKKPGSLVSWGLVLRNIGSEISAIVDDKRSLPFDIQLGYSKRLEHLPFRFSIIGHNLQKWYIRYDDPDFDTQQNFIEEVASTKSSFSKNFDNLFRHIIFNGEFLIGKSEQFRLRFGYNHLRKQEQRLQSFGSRAGFSFGFGFNIKKIKFDYGISTYHLAGTTNHISLRLNMGKIFSKI